MTLLEDAIRSIVPLDSAAMVAAKKRQNELTKPAGSLGKLEDLSVRIAGITGIARPRIGKGAVFVMAGDHGVASEGVSAYPQEVSTQMVLNFLSGGAAINVLASFANSRVIVTDCGVKGQIEAGENLYIRKIRRGTHNIVNGHAMSRDEAIKAIEIGIEVFGTELSMAPFDIAATGDMGIANTTPSAAIVSCFSSLDPEFVCGRGTGIDDEGLNRKIEVVRKSLQNNKPDSSDGIDVLAKVGGFEIGAIAGVVLAAAQHRIPVVIDGFISTAGALVARSLAPLSVEYMIAAHRSAENGHKTALGSLGLEPLLDLGMRLGEGTGAALAIALCDAACRILNQMATFGEAGVSEA